jgi:hypothetical protein
VADSVTITLTDLAGDPLVGVDALVAASGGPFVTYQGFRRQPGGKARDCGPPVAVTFGPSQTVRLPATSGRRQLPGNHFWSVRAVSDTGAAVDSKEEFFAATPANYSLHSRCVDSIQRRLVARNLPGIGERVYARKGYAADKVFFPCVVLSIDDEQERDLGGTTGSDDWGFPVKVEIVSNQHDAPELDEDYLYWRECVRDLHPRRLDDVPGSMKTVFEPRWVIRFRQDKLLYFTSLALLRCVVRKQRL